MIGLGLGIGLGIGSSGGVSTETQAWLDRLTTNGGTVDQPTIDAIGIWIASAKAHNYWDKILRCNWAVGTNLNGFLTPVKADVGNAIETNVGFAVGSSVTQAAGFFYDTGTRYLNTTVNPSLHLTLNDTHFGIYNRKDLTSSDLHGCQNVGATAAMTFTLPANTGLIAGSQYNATAGQGQLTSASAVAPPLGFVCVTRTAANDHRAYFRGNLNANNATGGGALPNLNFYFMTLNNNGAPFGQVVGPVAGYTIGKGLTAAMVLDFHNDLQVLNTALGRAV
jgi:hypothetical protein